MHPHAPQRDDALEGTCVQTRFGPGLRFDLIPANHSSPTPLFKRNARRSGTRKAASNEGQHGNLFGRPDVISPCTDMISYGAATTLAGL